MQILISGVALWWVSHLFKRLAPGLRARIGDVPGKLAVTAASVIAIVLMVIGYRQAEFVPVYTPLPGMGHLNNLLMLIAMFLFALSHSKGSLRPRIRHPMLTSVVVWAIAHLLVNGDLASIVLFGGIGLWAIVAMLLINARDSWVPPAPGPVRKDVVAALIALVVYGAVAGIHSWLGYNPFLGTYG